MLVVPEHQSSFVRFHAIWLSGSEKCDVAIRRRLPREGAWKRQGEAFW